MTTSNYSPADRALLERHVSSVDANVYTISNLPEEVIAVVFAYVSRSPRSFRDNLLALIKDGDIDVESRASLAAAAGDYEHAEARARSFHEKWVVGYGHSSVAEHAVVHLGIEKVSRLASAELELSSPFLSFTEYSQRYQKPERGAYHVPSCLQEAGNEALLDEYHELQHAAYDTYMELYHGLCRYHEERLSRRDGEGETAFRQRAHRQAFEDARYALTVAVQTSLGMTGNARAIRDALVNLYSDRYVETSVLAGDIKAQATRLLPTLIRYAQESGYQVHTRRALAEWAEGLGQAARLGPDLAGQDDALNLLSGAAQHASTVGRVRLVRWPAMELDLAAKAGDLGPFATASERQLHLELAARLLVQQGWSAEEALGALSHLCPEQLARGVALALEGLGEHDPALEVFRSARYHAQLCISEANWHQLLRHSRRIDFTYAPPSANNDYTIPPHVETAGLRPSLEHTVDRAAQLYRRLCRECPGAAPYVVTNAHRRHVTASLSLWELYHLANLRLRRDSQWDIRYAVADLVAQVRRIHPLLLAHSRTWEA